MWSSSSRPDRPLDRNNRCFVGHCGGFGGIEVVATPMIRWLLASCANATMRSRSRFQSAATRTSASSAMRAAIVRMRIRSATSRPLRAADAPAARSAAAIRRRVTCLRAPASDASPISIASIRRSRCATRKLESAAGARRTRSAATGRASRASVRAASPTTRRARRTSSAATACASAARVRAASRSTRCARRTASAATTRVSPASARRARA